ncbi:UDP-Glycosyltransferase/glycogen phosphorylase [Meredithblackwellia eburnea MCA 4105]
MHQADAGASSSSATSPSASSRPTHRTSFSLSRTDNLFRPIEPTPSPPPSPKTSFTSFHHRTQSHGLPRTINIGAGAAGYDLLATLSTRRQGLLMVRRSAFFSRSKSPFITLFILLIIWGLRRNPPKELLNEVSHGHIPHPHLPHLPHLPRTLSASYSSRRRVWATDHPFQISADPKPVHFLSHLVDYSNHPLSPHRPPPTQFTLAPNANFNTPVVGLITATSNPRQLLRETAISIFGQSLQNFVWVIVSDGTTRPDSQALLEDLAKDPRVVLLQNKGPRGISKTRNIGIHYLLGLDFIPPYLLTLDDDALLEFTALEKTVWLLESNEDWDIGGFPHIKFGGLNKTVNTGVHSGWLNFVQSNYVPGTAIYRSSAVQRTGCLYDEVNFNKGGEEWDFWMCLADAGSWGGSVPEHLFWYRTDQASSFVRRSSLALSDSTELKQKVHKKRPRFKSASDFPAKRPKPSKKLEPITWSPPFDTNLAHHEKTIMFIIPWLYVGGADIGALHMVQLYAEMGYRVTVLCTLYKFPQGVELRPWVLQFTHDIHIMPSFLRAHDFPRYIKYLVDSRGIDNIVMSNSQLTYEMLPSLTEQMPHVKFIDYLHNEAYDGWKSGGYPQYSVIMQRYIARTVTCSHYLKEWLIERGHDASRIGVVKLGIEIADFSPVTERQRAAAKEQLLDLEPETLVVSIVGRLDPQKRSTMVPIIAKELLKLGIKEDFRFVMLGDGPLKERVREGIEENKVNDFVHMLGTVQKPQEYLAATDIFLLPSMSEGISIATAEAMAFGLPILTARAGALPEQVGEGTNSVGGILVNHTLTSETSDAKLYAKELATLLKSAKLRKRLGANGRRNVETTFDWRSTLAGLSGEIELAENLRSHSFKDRTPNPAAYLAVQTVLLEMWPESEMLSGYGVYENTGE